MYNLEISGGSFKVFGKADSQWYAEQLGSDHMVSDSDTERYMADKKFYMNEKMACDLCDTVLKSAELAGVNGRLVAEKTGISFGTRYGSRALLAEIAGRINEKGIKGITPKIFSNCFFCGASSKTAIKLEAKAFNLTNFDSSNAGLDALCFACDVITEGRGECAFSAAGDEECGVYSALFVKKSSENEGGILIKGFSKSMIFGDDIEAQIEYAVENALNDAGIRAGDVAEVIALSDKGEETIFSVCEKLIKKSVIRFETPQKVYSAKGLLAVMYAVRRMRASYKGSVMIVQESEFGHLTCVILKK